MTKKHFNMLALILRRNRPVFGTPGFDRRMRDWTKLRSDIVEMCAEFNEHFDESRFIEATEGSQSE